MHKTPSKILANVLDRLNGEIIEGRTRRASQASHRSQLTEGKGHRSSQIHKPRKSDSKDSEGADSYGEKVRNAKKQEDMEKAQGAQE